MDSFDGRGQGLYLYRIGVLDAAGNQSEWSPAFPPVHIYDVTPPAVPVVTGVLAGERQVILRWRANREPDLREYWVWRETSAERLADVRRAAPSSTLAPENEPTFEFIDEDLDGLQNYYYRLAAVDTNGNVSAPTSILSGRTTDTAVPTPPSWEPLGLGDSAGEARLGWTHPDPGLACLPQRRETPTAEWQNLSGWLARGEYSFMDANRAPDQFYEYRLLVMDASGRVNTEFNLLQA